MDAINANVETHDIRSEGEDQASYERYATIDAATTAMHGAYLEAYQLAESGHVESAAFVYGYAVGIETLVELGTWSNDMPI